MRRFLLFSTALAVAVLPAPLPTTRPAQAQLVVACPFCADKLTQLWTYVKEVEQVSNTITMRIQQAAMLKNQITNMLSLPESIWHNISGNFQATQGLFQRGQQIISSASVVSSQLRGYGYYLGNLGDQATTFANWSQQSRDSLSATLAGMGLMRDQMTSDRQIVDRIRAQSAGAEGAKQAIQANTEMGSAMVNELHRTRELMIAEAQMHANWLYGQQQEKDRGRAETALFMAHDRLPENGNKRY